MERSRSGGSSKHQGPALSVRRFAPQEWATYRDLRLRALADSPDAFGSTFDREAALSDDDWATRLERGSTSSRELPLIAELDGEPIGLSWARVDDADAAVVHIYQVWVAADRRGHGAGKALLDSTIRWARSVNSRRIMLDVTASNAPATQLYLRAGFVPAGQPEPLRPGSALLSQPMQLDLS